MSTTPDNTDDPIRIPCEWICPDCGVMETDELAVEEHECEKGANK